MADKDEELEHEQSCWREASVVLLKTYKRHRITQDDIDVLFDNILLTGEQALEAVHAHIRNSDKGSKGNLVGDFFPSAAQLSSYYRMDAGKRKKSVKVDFTPTNSRTIQIDGWLAAALGKTFVEIIDYEYYCGTCHDTGWVTFYYYPRDYKRVLMSKDWHSLMDLNPEQGHAYRAGSCLCTECDTGRELLKMRGFKDPAYSKVYRLARDYRKEMEAPSGSRQIV